MKIVFVVACSVCLIQSFAQSSSVSISNDFKMMSGYTSGTSNGYDVIPTYNPSEIKGNPYFSEDWLKGSVITTDNQAFSSGLLFMYNKYNNELYYKKFNSDTTLKIDLSRVNSFTLIKDALHNFMRADYFDKKYAGEFFETLVFDNKKYAFLKLNKTILQDPPYSEVAQVAGGNRAKTFVEKNTYFIYVNKTLTEVDLKKKSFEKILSSDAAYQKYIKDNGGSFNESYIIEMFTTLNEQ